MILGDALTTADRWTIGVGIVGSALTLLAVGAALVIASKGWKREDRLRTEERADRDHQARLEDLDNTRMLLIMAKMQERASTDLIGPIVNALRHHSGLITEDEAHSLMSAAATRSQINPNKIQELIDRVTAEEQRLRDEGPAAR